MEHTPQIDPELARIGVRLIPPREQDLAECLRARLVERVAVGRASEILIAHVELRYRNRPDVPVHHALLALVVAGDVRSAINVRSEALALLGPALTDLSRAIAFELAEHDRDQRRTGT